MNLSSITPFFLGRNLLSGLLGSFSEEDFLKNLLKTNHSTVTDFGVKDDLMFISVYFLFWDVVKFGEKGGAGKSI